VVQAWLKDLNTVGHLDWVHKSHGSE